MSLSFLNHNFTGATSKLIFRLLLGLVVVVSLGFGAIFGWIYWQDSPSPLSAASIAKEKVLNSKPDSSTSIRADESKGNCDSSDPSQYVSKHFSFTGSSDEITAYYKGLAESDGWVSNPAGQPWPQYDITARQNQVFEKARGRHDLRMTLSLSTSAQTYDLVVEELASLGGC